MSTTAATPMTFDLSSTARVPMSRLVAVEVRKVLDTRAGRWFAIAILGLLVVVEVIYSFVATDPGQRDLSDYLPIAGGLLGYFLPILIVMSVTAEASQRNGLITFTLEPRRSRVVVAKLIAGVLLGLAMMVLAFVLAVAGTALGAAAGGSPDWSVSGHLLLNAYLISQLIGVFVGFAIGMLLMNTAAGIVGYFVYTFILPVAFGILGALSQGFEDATPWIDFNTAQGPLISGDYTPSSQEWLQILITGIIWLVLPLAIGIRRLLRIEFK